MNSLGIPPCMIKDPLGYQGSFIENQSIQPTRIRDSNSIYLNTVPLTEDYFSQYVKTPEGYRSNNPITFDSARAQWMTFDRPAVVGSLPVGNVIHDMIYTPRMTHLGQHYSTYKNITGGDIQYYIDPSIASPYFQPVYAMPAVVTKRLTMDPMTNPRYYYDRQLEQLNWQPCQRDTCLSSTHDQLQYREDIMEKQQRTRNSQSFSACYYS